MSASWYDVLGVARDASDEEIRSAWREAIDGLDPTDRKFVLYNKAAGVLLDAEQRAAYDADLPEPEPEPAPEPEPEPGAGEPAPEQGEDAVETAPAPAREPGLRDRVLSLPVLIALALLAVAAAAGAAYLQFGRTAADREGDLADARQAAESGLPKVFTYDHRFPERDHDQAARVLTGDLKDEYERLWDEAIAPNLERTEGTASSEVLGSGIVGGSEDEAEILVVLRTVTGNASQTQQLTLALTATMVPRDGVWLISDIAGWDPEAVRAPEEEPSEEPSAPDGDGQENSEGSGSD